MTTPNPGTGTDRPTDDTGQARPSKNIVLLADGTGNSESSPHKTNVWRIYQALDRSSVANQVAFYDNGVGTSSFSPSAIIGLAVGWGLARNIQQLYLHLCRTYEPGDRVYCFGFSRGSFTIRLLSNLITHEGIVDRHACASDLELQRLVKRAYHRHRREAFDPSLLSFPLAPIRDFVLNLLDRSSDRESYSTERHSLGDVSRKIEFIGVWDTVDAYGFPIDELQRAWDKVVWPLTAKDRDLNKNVKRAAHALALDEQRLAFEPTLWNERGNQEEGRISQVWFPGVHSSVGGGYPDDQLAFNSLQWMLLHARQSGLHFNERAIDNYESSKSALGPMYDNRAGLGVFYRYSPRDVDALCKERRRGLFNRLNARAGRSEVEYNEVDISRPKLHRSVFDRLQQGTDGYAPLGLPENYDVVEYDGTLTQVTDTDIPPEETDLRIKLQSYVWSLVTQRKAFYLGIISTLISVLLCHYRTPHWMAGYAAYLYFALAVLTVTLIAGSSRLKRLIKSEARLALNFFASGKTPPDDLIERSERAPLIRAALAKMHSLLAPGGPGSVLVEALSVIAFVLLLLAVVSKAVLTVAAAGG